jgi:hypothetical protein
LPGATGLAVFYKLPWFAWIGYLYNNATHQRNRRKKNIGRQRATDRYNDLKDFIGLVLLAFVIATPLAWLGMHKWLENFAYRTDINWWIFAASGLA